MSLVDHEDNLNKTLKEKIETVSVDSLSVREGNPNEMNAQETAELQYSINNIGYVQPIIVDQNDVIVDGANRFRALKQAGATEVDVVRINVKDEMHRALISQAMNKIRGEHNIEKDIQELRGLLGYDSNSLYELLHVDETGLDELQKKYEEEQQALQEMAAQEGGVDRAVEEEQIGEGGDIHQGYGEVKDGDRTADSNPVSRHAETYLHGGIKQLTIYFSNEEYQTYIEKIQKIMSAGNLPSHTEAFKYLVDEHMKNWGQEQ